MSMRAPVLRTRRGHPRVAAVLLIAAALLLGAWGAWRSFGPVPPNARERLQQQAQRIEALAQQAATLARSDQISRRANAELQATLAERDEEIAGLRADVAFYERLVGATGQRRGLAVQALALRPQRDPRLWQFTATLTQTLSRGAPSRGHLTLALDASDGKALRRLDWSALQPQAAADGVAYSFKYFQQVEGGIVLPVGVRPLRVIVRLQPEGAPMQEQVFPWNEVALPAATADQR